MSAQETLLHVFGKVFDVKRWQQLEYHPERIVLHPGYDKSGNHGGSLSGWTSASAARPQGN